MPEVSGRWLGDAGVPQGVLSEVKCEGGRRQIRAPRNTNRIRAIFAHPLEKFRIGVTA
jgi:hypothetical protein